MSACWSGQPDYVERLEVNNERLQQQLKEAMADKLIANMKVVELENQRSAIIEKCARVALREDIALGRLEIYKAIMALKDER